MCVCVCVRACEYVCREHIPSVVYMCNTKLFSMSSDSIEYHLGNDKYPIWERCANYREYPTSEVVRLLMGKDVPPECVCSSVPTRAQSNMSFVVNMKNVKDPKDLRADDNGVWIHKGLRSLWISVSGQKVDILSRKGRPKFRLGGSAKMFCVKKAYHSLQSSEDFRRIVITMEGSCKTYAYGITHGRTAPYMYALYHDHTYTVMYVL